MLQADTWRGKKRLSFAGFIGEESRYFPVVIAPYDLNNIRRYFS